MRLFNLAVDVPSASLTVGGTPLAHGVQYSLGSKWVPVPATQQTFAASGSAAPLASAPFTPPNAPEVFTTFLLGSKAFGYSLLPQVDAPGNPRQAFPISRFGAPPYQKHCLQRPARANRRRAWSLLHRPSSEPRAGAAAPAAQCRLIFLPTRTARGRLELGVVALHPIQQCNRTPMK